MIKTKVIGLTREFVYYTVNQILGRFKQRICFSMNFINKFTVECICQSLLQFWFLNNYPTK